MPNTVTTVYMQMKLPVPTVELGPAWAIELNAALSGIVDGHDHSETKGVKVTPLGLDISSDLDFGHNNATTVRSVRFDDGTADDTGTPIGGPDDARCLYIASGNLWYNNQAGSQIQLTNGATINVGSLVSSVWTQSGVLTTSPTILPGSAIVDQRFSTAADRTVTLPLAASVTAGRYYLISDATGNAAQHHVTVALQGGDTFVGGDTTKSLEYNGGALIVESDGASKWAARVLRGASTSANVGETRIRTTLTLAAMLGLTGMHQGDVCLVVSAADLTGGEGLFFFVEDGVGTSFVPTTYQSTDNTGHWWRVDGFWWGQANGLCTLDSGGLVRPANLPHAISTVDVESVVAAGAFPTSSASLVDVTGAAITPIVGILAGDIFEATATWTGHAIGGVTSEVALLITDTGGTTTGTLLNGGRATTTNNVDSTYSIQLARTCVTGGPVTAKLQARQVGGGGSTQINGWALKLRVTRP